MSHRTILVIGSLSHTTVHRLFDQPDAGSSSRSDRHIELGGRATNTAIAASRVAHHNPDYEDGTHVPEPRAWPEDDGEIEVKLIGAVGNEEERQKFETRLRRNFVDADYLSIKNAEPDYSSAWFSQKTGTITSVYGFSCSDEWTTEEFDNLERVAGVMPDLIILTMELKTKIVEHIIDLAHAAKIELILYASPGENLLTTHYEKVPHLICNENDAANMLGYSQEYVNMDTWQKIVQRFRAKGVKNVVVKAAHLGAYYKNEHVEGYSSGYKKINEIVDETGATASFVGTYAVELLRHREHHDWDIAAAVNRGNAACAVSVGEVGYEASLPWGDQVDAVEQDRGMQPLYPDLETLMATPKGVVFGWRGRRAAAS